MAFRGLLVMLVCLALIGESDGGLWRRIKRGFRKLVRGAGRVLKKVGRAVGKAVCKVGFGFVCPAAVAAAGGLIAGSTSGVGTGLVTLGVAAGKAGCRSLKRRCKRSADEDLTGYVEVPYSKHFEDYDLNGDKLITHTEFIYAIMMSIPLEDPEELIEPFLFADANGDDVLDTQEFIEAPFIFEDDFYPPYEKPFGDNTTNGNNMGNKTKIATAA